MSTSRRAKQSWYSMPLCCGQCYTCISDRVSSPFLITPDLFPLLKPHPQTPPPPTPRPRRPRASADNGRRYLTDDRRRRALFFKRSLWSVCRMIARLIWTVLYRRSPGGGPRRRSLGVGTGREDQTPPGGVGRGQIVVTPLTAKRRHHRSSAGRHFG